MILVYDFKEERVNKAHKLARQYLYWRQRSVFDGNINKEDLDELITKLNQLIVPDEDFAILYIMKTQDCEVLAFGKKVPDYEIV